MSILFVMIPLALVLLVVAVAAFFWAVRSGQFDDLEMQGTMVLFDEETPRTTLSTEGDSGGRTAAGAVAGSSRERRP